MKNKKDLCMHFSQDMQPEWKDEQIWPKVAPNPPCLDANQMEDFDDFEGQTVYDYNGRELGQVLKPKRKSKHKC